MGKAAGLYLIGLRQREPGLTRAKLARELHLDIKRLERWENGENRPGIDAIGPVLDRIGGVLDEFSTLWEIAPGTKEDAEAAIARTLGKQTTEVIDKATDAFVAALSPEELTEVISLAQRLSEEDRQRWLDIGRRFRRDDGHSNAE